ncbi:MAG: hypothetical protein WBD10_01240 [Acidobacteriaceae bacterium]
MLLTDKLLKLSRFTKLCIMTVAGLCLVVPLMMCGHGRLGAIVFLLWILVEVVIYLKMKPVPADFARARKLGQARTARSFRRTGYLYVAGLIIALCTTDYRHILWGPTLIGVAVCGGLIWFLFRSARRTKNMPPEEWERRVGK